MSMRTSVRWIVWGLMAGFLVSILAPLTLAQGRRGGRERGGAPQGPPVEMTGVIEAVMPGYIKVTGEDTKTWVLQVEPTAKVNVIGKAKPDFLRPGLFVSFSGDVDKRRAVIEEKITKMTLITPSDLKPVGAFPAQGGGGLGGVSGAAINQGPAAGGGNEGKKGAGPATERYDICGQYAGAGKKGGATVMAPNPYFKASITIEVAEDVDIDVDLSDPKAYLVGKKGDKIEVKGKQVQLTAAIVNDVKISLSEPLSGAQPAGKKPATRKTSGRNKKDEDQGEAAEGKDAKEKPEAKEEGAAKEEGEGKDEKEVKRPSSRRTRHPKRGEEAQEGDVMDQPAADDAAEKPAKHTRTSKKKAAAESDEEKPAEK
jgi:hypothetical protein